MSRRGGRIEVSVDVANGGAVAGDDVIQLYLHDPVASISQPVRRLRGFRRVTLAPGESTTVTFTVGTDDVGFYDNQAKFIVETGTIEVYVGDSSDTDQTASFTVV
jgi:beta-glucosidase